MTQLKLKQGLKLDDASEAAIKNHDIAIWFLKFNIQISFYTGDKHLSR